LHQKSNNIELPTNKLEVKKKKNSLCMMIRKWALHLRF